MTPRLRDRLADAFGQIEAAADVLDLVAAAFDKPEESTRPAPGREGTLDR